MQEAANKGKDAGRCPACGRVSLSFYVFSSKIIYFREKEEHKQRQDKRVVIYIHIDFAGISMEIIKSCCSRSRDDIKASTSIV